MKIPNSEKLNCVRCEPMGITRKARVLVNVDGLENSVKQPLCKSCSKEWKKEYKALQSLVDNDPCLTPEFQQEEIYD